MRSLMYEVIQRWCNWFLHKLPHS